MNNFRWITNLDTFAATANLFKLKPRDWAGVTERGEINHPDIGLGASLLLRGHESITKENWLDNLPVKDLAALKTWKSMQALLARAKAAIMEDHALVTRVTGKALLDGRMARAMMSRLDPGSTIFWHVDDGPYHSKTARFHLPLVTNPGCFLYSGPEMIHMEAGTLWYFNNHTRHSAANWGAQHRYHLIFEMFRAEADDA